MYVLGNLWNGKITPSERGFCDGSKYAELLKKSCALEKEFYAELSPRGKKLYKENYELQMQMISSSEQDAFIKGIRFGAQFMLDIIEEYHSPLPQVNSLQYRNEPNTGDNS